jgi:microcystin-dependent protein
MAQPYVGEIRMFAGSFAPAGWEFCDGQLLSISENETLFQLIGTTYGGDGEQTFALPDLRGRIPIHLGGNHILAETGGVESVSLTVLQMPAHNHPLLASTNPGTGSNPGGMVLCSSPSANLFIEGTAPDANFNPQMVSPVGGSQPHENMQPFVCVTFIISLFGIFPSPT